MSDKEIVSAIESLLFVQGEPLAIARLAAVLNISEEDVLRGLDALSERYGVAESGLDLVRKGDEVQLATKPANTSHMENFSKSAMQESLSRAALEVLSVIAYRGPIARSEIEAIRGVNCSVTLRNLLMRELIERKENADDARGYLYTVSFPFLRELGLRSVEELPEYRELSVDERLVSALATAKAPEPSENKA